jgi:hypothetical protein
MTNCKFSFSSIVRLFARIMFMLSNLKKTEELIIASMQIKNSEMGDNPVGKFLAFL